MSDTTNKWWNELILLGSAILLGSVIAFTYLIFEWIVNDGSNWIWNDLLQSNLYRWRVIPIAIAFSMLLSITYKLLKIKRVQIVETNLLSEIENVSPTTISNILTILIIGAVSLLAGASLGPEASLLAGVLGISAWFSGILRQLNTPIAKLIALSSVGALLCAFMLSLVPIAIPLLLLKKSKKISVRNVTFVFLICITTWSIVYLIKGVPYVEIPISNVFSGIDFLIAIVLGFFSVLIGISLKLTTKILSGKTAWIDDRFHWLITSMFFGLVLGVLYYLGGETIQFNGSDGSKLLEANRTMYTAAALFGLVILKLLATAWSASSGYRGGLVFPSVYMGLAFSYFIVAAFSMTGLESTGATIGAISGIFITMLSPALGIVLLFSIFPINLVFVVIAGAIGALLGNKVFQKIHIIFLQMLNR